MAMKYRFLNDEAVKDDTESQLLARRLQELEVEYLANEHALVAAQVLPETNEQQAQTKAAQIAQLQHNLAVVEAAHTALGSRADSVKARQDNRAKNPVTPAPVTPGGGGGNNKP